MLYWLCTVAAGVTLVAAVATGYRLVAGPGPGPDRRRRLGVDTRAHLSRPRDLVPLVVPRPGRLLLGRVGGRLVATENCSSGGAALFGADGATARR